MLTLPSPIRRAFSLADKELSVLKELHGDVKATVRRLGAKDPGLKQLISRARGYAVFPAVGKASALLGAAFGMGEVFDGKLLVGYAAVLQVTVGLQLGGQTFSEIVVFEDKPALERFKEGKTAFAASASAVLVKAGAASANDFNRGVAVFVASRGGMMLEAAVGGQKFFFKPAVLGRLEDAPRTKPTAKSGSNTKLPSSPDAKSRPSQKAPPARHHGHDAGRKRPKPQTASAAGGRRPARRAGKNAR